MALYIYDLPSPKLITQKTTPTNIPIGNPQNCQGYPKKGKFEKLSQPFCFHLGETREKSQLFNKFPRLRDQSTAYGSYKYEEISCFQVITLVRFDQLWVYPKRSTHTDK